MPAPIDRRDIPELLAPAGSVPAFFAALDSGADAVYAGADRFSARARARNFPIDDLAKMAAVCRRLGKRFYVAVNTLVPEREIDAVANLLSALARDVRPDAVIVHDVGIAEIARDRFSLPIHASTQMTIHTLEGVRAAASLGFRRIVLARELSVEEVGTIAAESPLDLEVFVHGALCYSLSGQCLFSSALGGRSGNRGECAQPCRRRFRIGQADSFPFSTRDLGALPLVPRLRSLGVASFKIEGRMKSADYVARVVAAYRTVLDAAPGAEAEALRKASVLLSRIPGRSTTVGPLGSAPFGERTAPDEPGAVGEKVGRVESFSGDIAVAIATVQLHAGDLLRFDAPGGGGGRLFTLRSMTVAGRETNVLGEGRRGAFKVPFPVVTGTVIHRLATHDAPAVDSEEACRRRLDAEGAPEKIKVDVVATFDGETLHIAATVLSTTAQVDVPVEPGGSRDASTRFADRLAARLAETGGTPFRLGTLSADSLPDEIFVPPSRLKAARRDLYAALATLIATNTTAHKLPTDDASIPLPVSDVPALPVRRLRPGRAVPIFAAVASAEEVGTLDSAGIDGYLLSLDATTIGDPARTARILATHKDRVVIRLPVWTDPAKEAASEAAVRELANSGINRFEANNIAHFRWLAETCSRIVAGWRLGTMNLAAFDAFRLLGADSAVLPLEMDRDGIFHLLATDTPTKRWVTLFAPVELMVSRMASVAEGSQVRIVPARQGADDAFVMTGRGGLVVVRDTHQLGLTRFAGELAEAGADAFLLDLSDTPVAERAAIVEAARRGEPVAGTRTFNYERRLF